MMKKLQVTFDGVTDTTGYLFSLVKCLSASLRCSPYAEKADDIIASSGFAFRMWVDGGELCPSATSIWDFKQQKPWVENGGLKCGYVERLWHEDAAEEERRMEAIQMIRRSIDDGFAPVAWDVSGCEWGIITGYDDENQILATLKIDGNEDVLPYEKLGRLEIPILSVLTVTGRTEKTAEQMVADTKRLAASHLRGEEWCENAKGLAAYDALITFIREKLTDDTAWNLEYMLGTYAALKWYAWKFFEKYDEDELAQMYRTVHEAWQQAFEDKDRERMIRLLEHARETESKAVEIMNR